MTTANKDLSGIEINTEGLDTIGLSAHEVEIHVVRALSLLFPESKITEWTRPNGEIYYSLTVERNGFNASFFSKDREETKGSD